MFRTQSLILLAVILCAGHSVVAQESGSHLVFTHVNVIDCTGGPSKTDMTVVVTGDRITAVGKTGDVVVPKDAVIVNAENKYMIPGLWDMHVHFRAYSSPLFIANGVTGVRIMFGSLRDIEARQEVRNRNTFIPDRKVASPPIADETFDLRKDRDVIQVKTELTARQAVQKASKTGFDSIKISSALRRELYVAISDEAKRLGIPFSGHVPDSISAEFASETGQKSIEHLTGIMIGCSRIADELQELCSATEENGIAKKK
jgi:imidazolonepropionase-like amidohydrolase